MASHFNRPGFELFDHDVYALCGDGDMMEGVSGEAASLAGHLGLANLCGISFKRTAGRPTLIIVGAAHGEPLGAEEIRLTKRNYGWPEDARFLVPDGVREHFAAGIGRRGRAARAAWMARFGDYRVTYPELADHLDRMQHRRLPEGWDAGLPGFPADPKGVGGRDASGRVLNALAKNVPWLVGGSADLTPSTKTRLTFEEAGDLTAGDAGGRNLHSGVREHAMGALLNGLSLSTACRTP